MYSNEFGRPPEHGNIRGYLGNRRTPLLPDLDARSIARMRRNPLVPLKKRLAAALGVADDTRVPSVGAMLHGHPRDFASYRLQLFIARLIGAIRFAARRRPHVRELRKTDAGR